MDRSHHSRGGKGLHVVGPLTGRQDYETVHDFSRAVVQHVASALPQRFGAKSGPANRKDTMCDLQPFRGAPQRCQYTKKGGPS
ncbi:hypothetical protein [Cupriavidus pauculus]|uniref:non-homologous end-joining DNA ligase LigD n=1 Tax=Cupriavidus pauculus TaxID=82633 RepID=UPI003F7383D6